MFIMGPSDVLDFEWDWSLWLPSGDTIASVVWTVSAVGLTVETNPAASHTSSNATVWIGASTTDMVQYTLTCQITTTAGRVAAAEQAIAVNSGATPSASRVYQVPVVPTTVLG